METTRRIFLGGLAAIPLPASAAALPNAAPTPQELDRYYSFLWMEFIALSKEMGVEVHSNSVMQRGGGLDAYEQVFTSPPSTRARAILSIGRT